MTIFSAGNSIALSILISTNFVSSKIERPDFNHEHGHWQTILMLLNVSTEQMLQVETENIGITFYINGLTRE